jgi:hypothetical protein
MERWSALAPTDAPIAAAFACALRVEAVPARLMRPLFWISLLSFAALLSACSSDNTGTTGFDAGTADAANDTDAASTPDATSGIDAATGTDARALDASPAQDARPGDSGSGGDSGTPVDAGGLDAGTTGQKIQTVFLILMENHNWSDILGNTAEAPYINNMLLPMASSTSNYFDNPSAVHPSEPNYIWLEAGDNLGITNDNNPSSNHQSTTQHLVTLLSNAGVTWKAYQEDIDGTTCPITGVNLFAPKHCAMLFFDDIVGNPPSSSSQTCISHVRPYSELQNDLNNQTVAKYNFITPNLCDDMHNNTGCASSAITNGDNWLQANIPMIMGSQAYQNNGAIFITWDESEGGEAPIGMIVLSPRAKGQAGHPYVGTTMYYHSSMLRTVQEIFGVTPLLRDAANRPSLSDLFTSFP